MPGVGGRPFGFGGDDATSGNTYVTWDSGLIDWFLPNDAGAQVFACRKKGALFGAQAPDPRSLPSSP